MNENETVDSTEIINADESQQVINTFQSDNGNARNEKQKDMDTEIQNSQAPKGGEPEAEQATAQVKEVVTESGNAGESQPVTNDVLSEAPYNNGDSQDAKQEKIMDVEIQKEAEQATAQVEEVATESGNVGESQPVGDKALDNKESGSGKKEAGKQALLQKVTAQYDQSIKEIIDKPSYSAVKYGKDNCLINLTDFVKRRGVLVRPSLNRLHGSDQKKTGESLLKDSPQHILITLPYSVAKAAGIKVEYFLKYSGDKKAPIPEDALVIIDGNGRIEYLYSKKIDEWPAIWATMAAKDKDGMINPGNIITIINTNATVWKGADYLTELLLTLGVSADKRWQTVDSLYKSGYSFTASAEWVRFIKGNITRKQIIREIETADNEMFKYSEHAERIYDVMKKRFGEGNDKVMKNRPFVEKLIAIWESLKDGKYDAKGSTDILVDFLSSEKYLPQGEINKILLAKKDGDKSRDTVRNEIFTDLWNSYKSAEL
jgi:hypothetical protein